MNAYPKDARSLVPGQLVRAKVASHEPWGLFVVLADEPDVRASIDGGLMDSRSGSSRALPEEYPPLGAEIDAVITAIDRYRRLALVRLSARQSDLHSLRWICGFCGELTVITAGGDGVSLDVRSADGPVSTCFPAHRRCLIDRLDPDFAGERARVAGIGKGE